MSDKEGGTWEGQRQGWEEISSPSTQAPLLLSSRRNKPGGGAFSRQVGAGILKHVKVGEASKDPH